MYRVIKASISNNKRNLRVASYKEFDNGNVLFDYKRMDVDKAEELAKNQSIKDPDNIYYVKYDDIMDPDSDLRWIDGKSYHYSQVQLRGGHPQINSNVESSTKVNAYTELSWPDEELKEIINEEVDAFEGDTTVEEILDCLLDNWDVYVDPDDLGAREFIQQCIDEY